MAEFSSPAEAADVTDRGKTNCPFSAFFFKLWLDGLAASWCQCCTTTPVLLMGATQWWRRCSGFVIVLLDSKHLDRERKAHMPEEHIDKSLYNCTLNA